MYFTRTCVAWYFSERPFLQNDGNIFGGNVAEVCKFFIGGSGSPKIKADLTVLIYAMVLTLNVCMCVSLL